MPSKTKNNHKREKLIQSAVDAHTDLSTQFSKVSTDEKMRFLEEKIAALGEQGDLAKANDLKQCVNWSKRMDVEAMAETEKMIQESFSKKLTGCMDPPRTDDGDQSPVYGNELQRLKVMWANGMDWNPSNPSSSEWLITCAAGDYDGMVKIIKRMPKNAVKNLIERRESLLNISAVFHVVKGASMLDNSARNFEPIYGFVNPNSHAPRHVDCLLKLIELGCNVNARDFAGFTSLHICVTRYGNAVTFKLARILLQNGANVNARNRLGETALIQPLMCKDLNFIKLLLDYGIDPTIKDNNEISAIGMNVYDKDLNSLFAEARKKKSKEMVSAAKGPDGILKCEMCGEPSSRRCTGCYVTRYCARECQQAHWRRHKKECADNKNRYIPVKLIDDADLDIVNISWLQGGKVTTSREPSKPPKVNFIVKIQVPLPSNTLERFITGQDDSCLLMALMIYDETRSVQGRIPYSDPSYKPLSEKVKAEGVHGVKGYFYAIIDKDNQLRININDIQPPRLW